VLYDVAVWYLQEGNLKEARSRLSRVVAMKPTDPDAFYVLGKVLRQQGENGLARIALEKARGLAYTNDRRRRIDEMLESLPPQ
jgi:Flp pilus assembly protein TadD